MRSIHQHLHLQHRQHTGRLLHRKHTSYRGLALVVVLAGIFMLGLNVMARATADDIVVYARNPAEIPTDAPVITSPVDGTTVTKSRLLVSGTCQVMKYNLVITIMDNGVLAGSGICDNNGAFSIPIITEVGKHTLIAGSYTITGDAGPNSSPVTIFHLADGVRGATDSIGETLGQEGSLVVTIDEPFIIFGPAKDAIWIGTIKGGTLPYKVVIDWSDGTTKTYTITKSGDQQFVYHYRSMQPHIITLRVTDARGRSVLKSYAAVTPYTPSPLAITPITPWGGSTPLGLYGAYLLLLAVFGGIWARAHPVAYALAPVPVRRRRNSGQKRRATGRR